MSVPPPPHAALPGSPLGLVLPTQQRTKTEVVVVSDVFPSCSSCLVHVCTAAVCPPTAVFNGSQLCTGVSRLTACPANHPLITTSSSTWRGFQLGIYYACTYIERAVLAADTQGLQATYTYVGGQYTYI